MNMREIGPSKRETGRETGEWIGKVEPAGYGRQRTPKIHIARKGKEDQEHRSIQLC